MSHHIKLDEKLEGDDKFRAWKYRISLVLEENELDSYISEEVLVLEGDEAKSLEEIWGLKWALEENVPKSFFVSWNSRTNRISIK